MRRSQLQQARNVETSIYPRPKRFAFLFDCDSYDKEMVDTAVSFNIRHWGGRMNPIIPVQAGEIHPYWRRLLLAADPDVVVASSTILNSYREILDRFVEPVRYIEADTAAATQGELYSLDCLTVDEIPRHVVSQHAHPSMLSFVTLDSNKLLFDDSSFILRNFGSRPNELALRKSFEGLGSAIYSLDPQHTSVKDVVDYIGASSLNRILPVDLSARFAATNIWFDLPGRRGPDFVVHVGDSLVDFAAHWNRAWRRDLSIDNWSTIWIPSSVADDRELLGSVVRLIEKSRPSWRQRPSVSVTSSTPETKNCQAVADAIEALKSMRVEIVEFTSLYDSFPGWTFHRAGDLKTSVSLPDSDDSMVIVPPKPEFLTSESRAKGCWMIDVEAQHRPQVYGTWTNVRPVWKLPTGHTLSRLFFPGQQSSRVNVHRFLSVVARCGQNNYLRFPSDDKVFDLILGHGRGGNIPARFAQHQVSDKGRYLRGTLSLFENLFYADCLLSDPYWFQVIHEMSGKATDEIRKHRFLKVIAAFSQQGSIDIFKDQFDALASSLASEAAGIHERSRTFDLRYFKGLFRPNGRGDFAEVALPTLGTLVQKGIFERGSYMCCPECGLRQWYTIEQIKPSVDCPACHAECRLPLESTWAFRLNALLEQSVSRHGIVALVRVLGALQSRMPTKMFSFYPPVEVFQKPTQALTDIDLVVLQDGRLIIGEVKSSPGHLGNLQNLVKVAHVLQPDEVLVAAIGEAWSPQAQDDIATLARGLREIDVNVTDMLLPPLSPGGSDRPSNPKTRSRRPAQKA